MRSVSGADAAASALDDAVRASIFRHLVEDARAPGVAALAAAVGVSTADVLGSLQRLNHPGDVVLSPGTDRIWMAHPFSALPQAYPVDVGRTRYWAPCAQEALGVGWLLGGAAEIAVPCGDCGEPLRIEVRGDRAVGEAVVHFLVPPTRHFRDIGFACATTLFFRSALHAQRWCAQRRLRPGVVVSLEQCMVTVRDLTPGRLEPGFRTPDEAFRTRVYEAAGLGEARFPSSHARAGRDGQRATASRGRTTLTSREHEVLELLAAARSNKQIARLLSLSPHTVDTHIRGIYRKLHVRSRTAAVAAGHRAGLVHISTAAG